MGVDEGAANKCQVLAFKQLAVRATPAANRQGSFGIVILLHQSHRRQLMLAADQRQLTDGMTSAGTAGR